MDSISKTRDVDSSSNFATSYASTEGAKPTEKRHISPARAATTMAFLYGICVIEGADIQLLPSSFRALEVSLLLTPSSLSVLALSQAMAQWICTPVWGALADNGWSRKRLITSGVMCWGVLTLLMSISSQYSTLLFLRIFNGMALGCLSPISQSLIVDMTDSKDRGWYFGLMQFSTNLGGVACAIGTSTVSNLYFFGGIQGWRIAFAIVAIGSLILGLIFSLTMTEPSRRVQCEEPSVYGEFNKVYRYMSIPTFRVLVLQGIFGCVPWSALSFEILYFQYIGVSDFGASILFATSMIGGAVGGVLGGAVGDCLSVWSWKHGRPLTAQISVFAGIPFIYVIFELLPRDASYFTLYQILVFLFGLLASWCATGVNRPILSEIVSQRDRASVFAWMCTIDGSFAALFGAPVVGVLAERVFGYEPSQHQIRNMPTHQRVMNADALSQALLWCCIVPWSVCFVCYCVLHLTYQHDIQELARETNDKTPL